MLIVICNHKMMKRLSLAAWGVMTSQNLSEEATNFLTSLSGVWFHGAILRHHFHMGWATIRCTASSNESRRIPFQRLLSLATHRTVRPSARGNNSLHSTQTMFQTGVNAAFSRLICNVTALIIISHTPNVDSIQLEYGITRWDSSCMSSTTRHHGLDTDRVLTAQNETETTVVTSRYRHQSTATNDKNNNGVFFICSAAWMLDYTISATQDSAYNITQIIIWT